MNKTLLPDKHTFWQKRHLNHAYRYTQRPDLFLNVVAILVCVMCSSMEGICQSDSDKMLPQPVPQSPNVAGLGKFGDYPVSFFTGIPEITIPIFEVKSGELSLPVSLNYHASGIKPTDVAGWVGLGWSVSAGGQISRSINGKPDEQYYMSNPLNASPSVCGTYYYLQYAARGVSDTEPDIFSYSFTGKRGKFILNANSPTVPFLIPYAPITIEKAAGLASFDVTDEGGVIHRFGKSQGGTAYTETTTATNGGNPAFSAVTAWPETEIYAQNSDDRISLSYQDLGSFSTHDISYSYTVYDQCTSVNEAPCPSNNFNAELHNIDSYGNQLGLQTIHFETGKVVFIAGTTNRSDYPTLKYLDKIQIQRLDGSVLKTIQFVYSYFSSLTGTPAQLKLDGVKFLDTDGNVVQQYSFDYFTNSFPWRPGNNVDLNRRDMWGYYNGGANTDLVLRTTIDYNPVNNGSSPVTIGGALDRSVNPSFIKEGVLKRITFPTGGFTEFDFESNRYSDGTNSLSAGGLRVKKITTSDGTNAPVITKVYKYGLSESGNGIPNFTQRQFTYFTTQQVTNGCIPTQVYTNYRQRIYYSTTAFDFDGFDSSPVLYPYVTEYQGDPQVSFNGKTIYEFDNGSPSSDVNHVVPNSGKYYRNSFFWKRGKLTRKTVFDKLGNKLSETAMTYQDHNTSSAYIGLGSHEFAVGSYANCNGGCTNEANEPVNSQGYFFTKFFQDRGAAMQTSIAETTYANGDVSKNVTVSSYSSFDPATLQLKKTTKTRSNHPEQLVTIIRYPNDLAGSVNASSTGPARGIYMLNAKKILNIPIETYSYLQNEDNTLARVIAARATSFQANPSNSAYVVPHRIFNWDSPAAIPLSQFTPVTVNGGSSDIVLNGLYKPRVTVSGYDQFSNVNNVQKENDVNVAYLWGYGSCLPIAEIKNALAKNVYHTSFEESIANYANEGKTGMKSSTAGLSVTLSNLDEGAYILTYFLKQGSNWILQQTSVTVSASGSYTISLAGQIDEVRFHPAAAEMTTYTYDPAVGVTSVTDANNYVTYYKYDKFMRLEVERDSDQNIMKKYQYNYKNLN